MCTRVLHVYEPSATMPAVLVPIVPSGYTCRYSNLPTYLSGIYSRSASKSLQILDFIKSNTYTFGADLLRRTYACVKTDVHHHFFFSFGYGGATLSIGTTSRLNAMPAISRQRAARLRSGVGGCDQHSPLWQCQNFHSRIIDMRMTRQVPADFLPTLPPI